MAQIHQLLIHHQPFPLPCEDYDSMPTGAHVDHGDITVYGGVASAYVPVPTWRPGPMRLMSLLTSPQKWSSVPPLMDTSVSKAHESHERLSHPELRCFAWTTDQLPEVRAAVEAA